MGEENLDIFYTLETLEHKILFVNKVLFGTNENEILEWLIKFEDDILFNNYDGLTFTNEDKTIEFQNTSYNIIKVEENNYFINVVENYKINVFIISNYIYVNYSDEKYLNYLKTTLFNNDILFTQSKENVKIPRDIKEYFNYDNTIVYENLGTLPFSNSLS